MSFARQRYITTAEKQLTLDRNIADKQNALAKQQLGLTASQQAADNAFRNQLLEYLGITNQPGGEGALNQPGGDDGLFRELLGRQDGSREEQLGLIQGFGDSQRADIARQFDTSLNNSLGRLETRGLGSSSLAEVAQGTNAEGRGRTLLDLEDRLIGNQLGVIQSADAGIAESYQQQLGNRNSLLQQLIGKL